MSKVALIQMVSSPNLGENLKQVEKWMRQAKEQDVELVVLPENFAFMGFKETDKLDVAEIEGQGPIQEQLSRLAEKMRLWVVAGTISLKGVSTKVKASCLVYDETGKKVARYDKIHLFDVQVSDLEVHQESLSIEPGERLVVVQTPVGNIGLTVCYDLRFPELYTLLQKKGAEIFVVPSAFTEVTGRAHWEVLLRARAIENLSYVLAPNQGGKHENGRCTYGHSLAVDPWGSIIGGKKMGAGIVVVDVDLHRVHQLRKQFPCNEHHVLNIR